VDLGVVPVQVAVADCMAEVLAVDLGEAPALAQALAAAKVPASVSAVEFPALADLHFQK
jgi:hypothetical protein